MSDESVVLVIGTGRLGCEIIKNLSLTGIKQITVVDNSKIENTLPE